MLYSIFESRLTKKTKEIPNVSTNLQSLQTVNEPCYVEEDREKNTRENGAGIHGAEVYKGSQAGRVTTSARIADLAAYSSLRSQHLCRCGKRAPIGHRT